MARQLLDADREAAAARCSKSCAATRRTTLTELRELAHGIYPPLLMDRGLPRGAARRGEPFACSSTDVEADVGRYPPDVEAAVYFCCLEAMQNAGKHAGEGCAPHDHGREPTTRAASSRSPTTAPASTRRRRRCKGHGFVNMADRLGAIGGTLTVESAPGQGTTISGEIPLTVGVDASRASD